MPGNEDGWEDSGGGEDSGWDEGDWGDGGLASGPGGGREAAPPVPVVAVVGRPNVG